MSEEKGLADSITIDEVNNEEPSSSQEEPQQVPANFEVEGTYSTGYSGPYVKCVLKHVAIPDQVAGPGQVSGGAWTLTFTDVPAQPENMPYELTAYLENENGTVLAHSSTYFLYVP